MVISKVPILGFGMLNWTVDCPRNKPVIVVVLEADDTVIFDVLSDELLNFNDTVELAGAGLFFLLQEQNKKIETADMKNRYLIVFMHDDICAASYQY